MFNTFIMVLGYIFLIILSLFTFIILVNIAGQIFYSIKFRKLKNIQDSEEFKKFLENTLKPVDKETIEKNNGVITDTYKKK